MTPYSKKHFLALIALAITSTFMALNEDRMTRMYILIAVLVLQHAAFILFMYDYDKAAIEAYKK